MTGLGVAAKKIAADEAASDLGGDTKFSGWKPPLETRFDHVGEGKILFKPTARSAGPWTVAEYGRNRGNASGFAGPGAVRSTGLTSRTKSGGVRKVRATAGRQWNGYTQGKGTATRSTTRIDRHVDREVDQLVSKAVRGFWT